MGVDISASRIRLLELDGRGDTHRVLSYASEPLPAEAIANEQIIDAEAVAASMKRALERSGSRTRRAAIAVGGLGNAVHGPLPAPSVRRTALGEGVCDAHSDGGPGGEALVRARHAG